MSGEQPIVCDHDYPSVCDYDDEVFWPPEHNRVRWRSDGGYPLAECDRHTFMARKPPGWEPGPGHPEYAGDDA